MSNGMVNDEMLLRNSRKGKKFFLNGKNVKQLFIIDLNLYDRIRSYHNNVTKGLL